MKVLTVTKENFNDVVNTDKKILIDFWASWCMPCKMQSPIVDQFADLHDDVVVGKVNVDEQPELARHFGVMSIPTLVVIKDGKIANAASGFKPLKALEDFLA